MAASGWSGTALAQAPAPPDKSDELDEIVVTGSRIRGAEPVGSTVIKVSRQDIELAAPLSTTALIQRLPQVFNLGVSENSRGQSGGSGNITYGSAINLRGLGPYCDLDAARRTSRRASGHHRIRSRPSIVPTAALGRVEVVADGASALYGSDAVAGVVNLIPRRDFEGVEVKRARWLRPMHTSEKQGGLIGGMGWDSGHVMAALEYSFHSNLNGADRDFFRGDLTARGGRDFRVAQCSPGNIVVGGVSLCDPRDGRHHRDGEPARAQHHEPLRQRPLSGSAARAGAQTRS